MPFAIMLMPADVGAPPPHYRPAVEAAVQENGGRIAAHGVVRLADGGQFIFENNDFWATQLSTGVCRVIFDAALHTNTYVNTAGSDLTPLKVSGSRLEIPPELGPAVIVSNPGTLCDTLQSRFARWKEEMGRLRRKGEIGADDQPLEPPPSPGAEPRLSNDTSGIAAKCEAQGHEMASRLGWKFVHSIVTRNAQWGVVWRADIAPEADTATWFRDSCWRSTGTWEKAGISISSRPLKMFDGSKNIKPLPVE